MSVWSIPDKSLVEMVVWRVPTPVPPTPRTASKYRPVFIVDRRRVLGCDDERGKGDHRHVDDREEMFDFVAIDDLVDRFVAEVEAMRSGS